MGTGKSKPELNRQANEHHQGLVLIPENERLKFTDNETGAVVFYRRPTPQVKRRIVQYHLGADHKTVNYEAVQREIIEYSIIEWENVYIEVDGVKAPANDRAYAIQIIANLSDNSYVRFLQLIGLIPSDAEKQKQVDSEKN